MNSLEKGNITELQVQLELVKRGYLVFTPVNDGCYIDLIVKIGEEIKSVQVKTARPSKTGFIMQLSSSAGGKGKKLYCPTKLDYFATFYNGKIYMIPVKDVEGKFEIVFRFNSQYKNQNKPFYAKDYEV